MPRHENRLRMMGLVLFGYFTLQAVGHSPTHYQTLINVVVLGGLFFLSGWILDVPSGEQWKIGLALLLVGGLMRGLWAWLVPTQPVDDFAYYARWAMDFAGGKLPASLPKNFLYPWILSLGYRIHPAGLTGRLLNALASTANIGLIYLLGRKLISPAGASLSALFFAFLPSEINMVSVLGTEVTATLMLVLTAYVFLPHKGESAGWKRLLLAGVCLGVGLHFRSSTLFYLPMFLIVIYLYRDHFPRPWWGSLSFFSGAALTQMLLVLVYSLLLGQFSSAPLTTQDSYPFLSGTNVATSGMWNQEDATLYFSWPEEERDRLARREALRRIVNHPLSHARIVVAKMSILFRDNAYGNKWSLDYLDWERWSHIPFLTENYAKKLNGALAQAVYIAIWAGALLSFGRKEVSLAQALALGILVFTILPHTILETQRRYHHYLMPFLILGASAGIEAFFKGWDPGSFLRARGRKG